MNRRLASILVTVAGGVLLVAGVAVLFWPASVILAGVLLLAAGLFGIDVDKTP